MDKHHINTLRRIRLVLDIVEKHYEPGNNAKIITRFGSGM